MSLLVFVSLYIITQQSMNQVLIKLYQKTEYSFEHSVSIKIIRLQYDNAVLKYNVRLNQLNLKQYKTLEGRLG